MFYSTRDSKLRLHASQAIISGLSKDGGLFLPDCFPVLNITQEMLSMSYSEIAFLILRMYLDDFSDEEIKYAINKAYCKENFAEKIFGLHNEKGFSFLELFHGSTITFKDMALSILPYLMEISLKKNHSDKKMLILTATSGDTGSAALSNFSKAKNIEIKVLYPENGVSAIQEKQMLSFSNASARAYALKESNFDDCQRFVKELLNEKQDMYLISSANSINVGRLLPQIVYYYASYIQLCKENVIQLNDKMDVIVPTGNFGNIFACYLAKKMGCPIGNIVCSSNENRVLTDFFETGVYSLNREFKKTNSPSMDILISSNLERLLYLLTDDTKVNQYMKDLKEKGIFEVDDEVKEKLKEMKAYSIDQKETLASIQHCFATYHYLIDPHTAVSYGASRIYKSNNHVLIVSTASPYKFPLTILESFNIAETDDYKALKMVEDLTKVKIPPQLLKLIHHDIPPFPLYKNEVRGIVYSKKNYEVKVPATSANLGSGFDVCGIALNLYNEFSFKKADKDETINFDKCAMVNNLVLNSYKKYFEVKNLPYIPVQIKLISKDVFESRGLGSSATCIIAGLLAANEMCNRLADNKELLTIATSIEGHPDNVAPCLLGGFKASIKVDDKIESISYDVNEDLHFIVAVPDYKLSTSKAREVLPHQLSYKDIIYNTSRIIHLPKALKEGDLALLNVAIEDSLHTPYRLSLLKDGETIFKVAKENHLPVTISGSGSTILIISKDDSIIETLKKQHYSVSYEFIDLKVDSIGATIKEA